LRYPGYVARKLIMVNGQRYHFAVKISDGAPRLSAQRPRHEASPDAAGRAGSRETSAEIAFGQVARDGENKPRALVWDVDAREWPAAVDVVMKRRA